MPPLVMVTPKNIADGLLFALVGYAGTCIKGSCQAASFLETAKVRSLVSLIQPEPRAAKLIMTTALSIGLVRPESADCHPGNCRCRPVRPFDILGHRSM